MIPFTSDERMDLVERLEDKDLFLRALWGLTEVYYTDEISTAAVTIIDDRVLMLFNKEFWEGLPPDAQLFVVCHEQLHLMLDHFTRLKFKEGDVSLKNKAADVAINHLLIRNYYFTREMIPNWEKYCWIWTVFPDQKVSDNETAEHYYALLKQREDKGEDSGGETIDDHQYGEDGGRGMSEKVKEAISEASKQVCDKCCSQEDEPSKEVEAGSASGNGQQIHSPPKRKRNWKRVYRRIPKKALAYKMEPHWVITDRRQTLFRSNMSLPGDMEIDSESRVNVFVYLDTSGSCMEDAKYFLKSAISLPSTLFNMQMFGFDASIYPIPLKPPYKLTGFGGTSFQAVADHMEGHKIKVDAAIVFTDGYAGTAHCRHPRKWHWFITPDGTAGNIAPGSNTYMLKDFDWKS